MPPLCCHCTVVCYTVRLFVTANYDWMLPEARGHASGYVADLVAFLDATFMLLLYGCLLHCTDVCFHCTVVCYTVQLFDVLYGCLLQLTMTGCYLRPGDTPVVM